MWRGIPFAAPPVGDLRFRKPFPVVPWTGVRDASEFGDVPMQDRKGQFVGVDGKSVMSEDCLTVNVIVPAAPADAPRPVMVWIYGGAYSAGSGRQMNLQGEGLARDGDIVFVNFNYRLGALGYLDFTRFSTPGR
ncbi:MAG: carboxylesterase family protein, partial [Actinomycetota bacterium]